MVFPKFSQQGHTEIWKTRQATLVEIRNTCEWLLHSQVIVIRSFTFTFTFPHAWFQNCPIFFCPFLLPTPSFIGAPIDLELESNYGQESWYHLSKFNMSVLHNEPDAPKRLKRPTFFDQPDEK